MRRAWIVAGVAILCLPMVFVGYLLLAVHWARLDGLTMSMGDDVSRSIANVIVSKAGWDKAAVPAYKRAVALDPDNSDAWEHVCWADNRAKSGDAEVSCTRAVGLMPTQGNHDALGDAQMRSGKACAAMASYQQAAHDVNKDGYLYVEEMGRAAVRCGDFYTARVGLELATQQQQKDLAGNDLDVDEADDEKKDLQKDREYLAITLNQLKDVDASKTMCLTAHPELQTCTCWIDGKAEPVCGGQRHD